MPVDATERKGACAVVADPLFIVHLVAALRVVVPAKRSRAPGHDVLPAGSDPELRRACERTDYAGIVVTGTVRRLFAPFKVLAASIWAIDERKTL